MRITAILFCALTAICASSNAALRITEWGYSMDGGEFVELTNIGGAPVDATGYSYDDDSQTPGGFDLSGFGTVAPGESVVFTEATDLASFAAFWSLDPSVKLLGGVSNNLGRNDQINIYDAGGVLVDSLTYGDQDYPGTIRTQNVTGNPSSLAVVGADSVADWVLSFDGDAYGSVTSLLGEVGNPGSFSLYVPEPSSALLVIAALAAVRCGSRR